MYAINQVVNVNSFYFSPGGSKAFPRSIEFGTTRYTFSEGLQYLVNTGERLVKLFDMTDGKTQYRLRLENDQWTLLGTKDTRSTQ